MSTIYFNEFKYIAYTPDISDKKLENRNILIFKNIGLASRRFVIKLEEKEKQFYITDDFKTLGDDVLKNLLESKLENLKGMADFFNYNEFQLYGVIFAKKPYFHSIKINGLFFDYEDTFKLFRSYDLEMDVPIYRGINNSETIKKFAETFKNVTVITTDPTIDEKAEPLFYIAKHEKILDREEKLLYEEACRNFIDMKFGHKEGVAEIKKFLDSKFYYTVYEREVPAVCKLIVTYIYDAYKIELQELVRKNNFIVFAFDKVFRDCLEDYVNNNIKYNYTKV